jgi:N-acetylmuramoyl-L-alanine amidase
VVQELQRLKPQKVILLGGTVCLSPEIEKNLEQLGLSWERIGGVDRYETSVLLANRLNSDSVIISNGDNFPDALSAATYAGIKQIPIVLTSTTLPDADLKYLKGKKPQHIIVIGGEVVVPSQELSNNNFTIETRLGGQDRYDTNAKVNSTMKDTYQSNDLFVASGITFPDAVAGTVLASKYKAPLLLTEQNDIPPAIYNLMRLHMAVEPPVQSTSTQTSTSTAMGNGAKKGIVTASSGLNLRDNPSSSGNLLVTIPTGTTIDLTSYQNHWYQTTYQSKTGWVSEEYITLSSTTTNTTSTTTTTQSGDPKQGTVTASAGLNLRDAPSSTGNLLATIPSGTTIILSNFQNHWYQTTYQAKTGWVSDSYISLTSSTNSSTESGSALSIDLTPNGKVYILGGTGVISSHSQSIIEGKTSSIYSSNLKEFPQLPSSIKTPTTPSTGDSSSSTGDSTPTATNYDPSKEVLVNPFDGIPADALSGKTIMLDPGHGGPDTGAVGPNHTYEKTNTLAIALDLKATLEQAGATVLMTREDDSSPATTYTEIDDLQARVNEASKSNPDLFISIHNDSFDNPNVQGTTTYYSEKNPQQQKSQQLASSIQSAVIDALKTNDRGVKDANFYVIRYTTMPAILLETAFISSPYEEARLQNETFRKNVAAAVFRGIYNYYKNPPANS